MPAYTIRIATPLDTEGIVSTIKEVYDEYNFEWEPEGYHADLYDLEGKYIALGHTFWVAEQDGQIVGTGALERFPAIPGPAKTIVEFEGKRRIGGCDSSIERVYVRPSARRQGIGKAISQVVFETAREEKLNLVEIWSDKRFKEAHQMYQAFGAQQVGDRLCHDPEQSPEWGFVLDLSIH
ncbi:MAG: GNAT family N-acetyltransferase [Armatimonadetes bacterium]|nr:GNAT family N-acetyltransferase [Armatimonadota bacterium]